MKRYLLVFLGVAMVSSHAASWMISGNENKIDLSSGTALGVLGAAPDSLTFLDFDSFPPAVFHLTNIANSVIGPPSNIAISPDRRMALVANSVRIDPDDLTQFPPESQIHIIDLKANPPEVIGSITASAQPSGISFLPDGRRALVANRAGGTVSVLSVDGLNVEIVQTVEVCEPEESASDVAVHPNGELALVSVQKGGYLRVLEIGPDTVVATERKLSVYGEPYRCVITPDGALGLTAGAGQGNGLDNDALTIVDLGASPIRTVGYATLGAVPESFEVSPDGQWVAAVVMNGSNRAPDDPQFSAQGRVVLLARMGKNFWKVQELPTGRIPEGVAFTQDGRFVVVQCHPDRELWVFVLENGRLRDSGLRIPVPGMPSSLRAL